MILNLNKGKYSTLDSLMYHLGVKVIIYICMYNLVCKIIRLFAFAEVIGQKLE